MAEAEWRAPVRLRWFDGERQAARETTVAGVLGHLLAVDGLVATGIGLPDPMPSGALPTGPGAGPQTRTEVYWALDDAGQRAQAARERWREQSHALIRDVSFLAAEDAGSGGERPAAPDRRVDYGGFTLPLRDAFLDRAFECWLHAGGTSHRPSTTRTNRPARHI